MRAIGGLYEGAFQKSGACPGQSGRRGRPVGGTAALAGAKLSGQAANEGNKTQAPPFVRFVTFCSKPPSAIGYAGRTNQLSDGGHEGRRLEPQRDAAVRCSALGPQSICCFANLMLKETQRSSVRTRRTSIAECRNAALQLLQTSLGCAVAVKPNQSLLHIAGDTPGKCWITPREGKDKESGKVVGVTTTLADNLGHINARKNVALSRKVDGEMSFHPP